MGKDFLADHHIVAALYPVADCFSGGVDTDVISLKDYNRVTFVIMTGAVEDANISNLVTVNACTDSAKAGATAMAFKQRRCLSSATVDTWRALTAATSSGFNFANESDAGVANVMWVVEVTADEVGAALDGADFVYLTIAETADKTLTAGAIAILSEPRYSGSVPQTAIA